MVIDPLFLETDPVLLSFSDLIAVRTGNFSRGPQDRDPLFFGQMGQLNAVFDHIFEQVNAFLYFFY
jgi:hypothetical protein